MELHQRLVRFKSSIVSGEGMALVEMLARGLESSKNKLSQLFNKRSVISCTSFSSFFILDFCRLP